MQNSLVVAPEPGELYRYQVPRHQVIRSQPSLTAHEVACQCRTEESEGNRTTSY